MSLAEHIVNYLISVAGLIGTLYAIIRVRRLQPFVEREADGRASEQYAGVATQSADLMNKYLERIKTLEDKAEILEGNIDKLEAKIKERDDVIQSMQKELLRRDELISQWAKGIKKLLQQLQDSEIEPSWKPDSIGDFD